ncbi:unnamed protein product [Ambrosiozyma monospora]|uniref:Unnamed protein product n=1 Tax=Ambrosiozyma monospora TaxID=43982 RepID=A0A9W6Z1M4_AMBMO|nr:unnamed protein product [Ambrosiozyma monospora]
MQEGSLPLELQHYNLPGYFNTNYKWYPKDVLRDVFKGHLSKFDNDNAPNKPDKLPRMIIGSQDIYP